MYTLNKMRIFITSLLNDMVLCKTCIFFGLSFIQQCHVCVASHLDWRWGSDSPPGRPVSWAPPSDCCCGQSLENICRPQLTTHTHTHSTDALSHILQMGITLRADGGEQCKNEVTLTEQRNLTDGHRIVFILRFCIRSDSCGQNTNKQNLIQMHEGTVIRAQTDEWSMLL